MATTLDGLRDRFARQAASLHGQPYEDANLAELAKCVLSEAAGVEYVPYSLASDGHPYSNMWSDKEKQAVAEAHAKEATVLLSILTRNETSRESAAPEAFRVIFDALLAVLLGTSESSLERDLALALFALPPLCKKQQDQFDAAFREASKNVPAEKLMSILAWARGGDNAPIIQRMFQGIVPHTGARQLLLANRQMLLERAGAPGG